MRPFYSIIKICYLLPSTTVCEFVNIWNRFRGVRISSSWASVLTLLQSILPCSCKRHLRQKKGFEETKLWETWLQGFDSLTWLLETGLVLWESPFQRVYKEKIGSYRESNLFLQSLHSHTTSHRVLSSPPPIEVKPWFILNKSESNWSDCKWGITLII